MKAAALLLLSGLVRGEVECEGRVVRVAALDRSVPQKIVDREVRIRVYEGEVAGRTYSVADLPGGTYDLYFETADGTRYEGADLRVEGSSKKLREKDRKAVAERVLWMKTWSNKKRVLRIEGNGEHAKALVELMRTRPTSYDGRFGGTPVVWRVEIWYYRKLFGTWRREEPKVLRRFLRSPDEASKWRWAFLPELGGVDVREGEVRRDVRLPAPAASLGRMGLEFPEETK